MASRVRFFLPLRLHNAFLLALLTCSFIVLPASAKDAGVDIPALKEFVATVSNGDAKALRGVYVQNLMAFTVTQQPANAPGFVSLKNDQVTQFTMASQAGNVGLLAHNYLAGNSFSKLKSGDVVILIYGDGHTESFSISNILRYQAIDPMNAKSDFRDLTSQATLTASQLFDKVYRGGRHVTFQTCIEADGNVSWGRLFVIAEPLK